MKEPLIVLNVKVREVDQELEGKGAQIKTHHLQNCYKRVSLFGRTDG